MGGLVQKEAALMVTMTMMIVMVLTAMMTVTMMMTTTVLLLLLCLLMMVLVMMTAMIRKTMKWMRLGTRMMVATLEGDINGASHTKYDASIGKATFTARKLQRYELEMAVMVMTTATAAQLQTATDSKYNPKSPRP